MSEAGDAGFALFGVGLSISAAWWFWTALPWSSGPASFVYLSIHMTIIGGLIVSMDPVSLKHQ
jgi:hypothetical protein